MLRKIISIAHKEFRLWVQVPGNWLVVFLLPFAFIGILGSVFRGGTLVVTAYAVNEDQGEHGAEIIELLEKSENLEFEILATQAEADQRVGKGDRMAAVVIPKNFSELITADEGASLLVIVDPARENETGIVTGLVQEALIKPIVFAEIERALSGLIKGKTVEGVDENVFATFVNAGIKAVVAKSVNEAIDDPLIKIEPKPFSEQATQTEINLFNSMAPGFALAFAFFMVSHLGETVVNERSTGTLRRLIITPVSRLTILIGKALPFFVIGVIQLAFVLGLCNVIFGVPLGNAPLALVLVIVSTALAIAGMGILIAALARNETQAGVVAIFIVLAMAAISGSLLPQVKVPGLSFITPHHWAMEGIQNVISRGMGVEGVLLQSGVLLGMAVLFFAIGAARFKYE